MSMQTDASSAPAPSRRQSRGRSAAVWIVLVLAGLFLLLSTFAVWINRVALNTDVFTNTSSELLDDDRIRSAVATRVVDELYANVDVQAEIEEQLPDDYKGLSGTAAAGLRQASYQIVNRALEQPAFQRLFSTALEETHTTLVQVLEGGGPRVSTEGGEVTLDLNRIILETADRIGIGEQVADRIPPETGRIVILRSDELDTAQDAFQLLRTLAWLLPLLTIAAFAIAVWVARDRRRAVRGIGFAVIAVGLLGLVAARLTRDYLVDSLVAERDNRQAANNAWDILTDLMRGSFRLLVLVGILFLVAAWLAGPGRRAVALRGALAPAFRNRLWPFVGLAVVTLAVVLTGPVKDASWYFAFVVLILLGATWIELMRRQTLLEFPDAEGTALFADARTRMSDWWESRQAERAAERQRPAAPAVTPPAVTDITSRLSSLADLHTQGKLTDEEYASAKARVLAGD